ncbi:unnamed protein product [marine sediment metagenome]|uniref:Uncharacterized protein n=1 Tax=marine sediment metagenome TaxID=412755 RepID=X0UHH8_9ZZZZ
MKMQNVKKKLVLFVFLVLISSVSAYPIIVSENGVNHPKSKELVYSIPEHYFKYVERIDFVNEPIKKYGLFYSGWYYVYWTKTHSCFNGRIWIYNNDLFSAEEMIWHELCHIADHCLLKNDYSTDKFANNCKLEQLKWN